MFGGTTGGLDGDDIGSVLDLSSVVSGDAGGASSTFGGKVAGWPDAKTINGFFVSAGERLTGTGIPELTFHIEQQPVVAGTRKMRALWTLEASQDLKAYHNLDLERELTELLSKELALEIDRELLEDMRMIAYNPSGITDPSLSFGGWIHNSLDLDNSNSIPQLYGPQPDVGVGANAPNHFIPSAFLYDLNAAVPNTNNPGSNVFVIDLTASDLGLGSTSFAPQHLGHRYSNLLALLNFARQDVYRTTHRGPANWFVTSPLIGALLESAAKLEGGLAPGDRPTNMGQSIEYKGKFAGVFDMYVDPLWPEDEILLGFKGSGPMDSGFVYAPYIPLQQLPTITDPESFQPRKGILTRYGKAAIQPDSRFFRVIRVVGPDNNSVIHPFFRVSQHGGNTDLAYGV